MGAFSDGLYFEEPLPPKAWLKDTLLRISDRDNWPGPVRKYLADQSKLARYRVKEFKKEWQEVERFVNQYSRSQT